MNYLGILMRWRNEINGDIIEIKLYLISNGYNNSRVYSLGSQSAIGTVSWSARGHLWTRAGVDEEEVYHLTVRRCKAIDKDDSATAKMPTPGRNGTPDDLPASSGGPSEGRLKSWPETYPNMTVIRLYG